MKPFIISLLFLGFLLSCGKQGSNRVDRNSYNPHSGYTPGHSGHGGAGGGPAGNIDAAIAQARQAYPCARGPHEEVPVSIGRDMRPWPAMPFGTWFVGASRRVQGDAGNDLIFIQKLNSGTEVDSYNAKAFICPTPYDPIRPPLRPIGIPNMDNSDSCGLGKFAGSFRDSARTLIVFAPLHQCFW